MRLILVTWNRIQMKYFLIVDCKSYVAVSFIFLDTWGWTQVVIFLYTSGVKEVFPKDNSYFPFKKPSSVGKPLFLL